MGAFVSNANDTNVANNYKYDAEGRLIQDLQEEIAEIQWRVDGKVKKIIRTTGSTRKNLSFDYDAMGNRIAKHIETLDGTRLSSTYYILDAQGNPLAMYELDYEVASFELTERQIYGSARLGSLKTKVDVFGSAYEDYTDIITTHAIGDRNYELSNHLGNVLTVVSDKLHSVDDGNGAVASYTADLVMSCDYSPFGVTLDGRGVEGSYRFGFNGQEKDDEVSGSGNSYTAEFWQYDSRLGRRWNIDPIFKKHESPYACFANNPMWFVDFSGADTLHFDVNQNLNFSSGGEDVIMVDCIRYQGTETYGNTIADYWRAYGEFISWFGGLSSEERNNLRVDGTLGFSLNEHGQLVVYSRIEYDVAGIKDYLGTVAGEASNNAEEAQGIGAVILNRLNHTGNDITGEGMDSIDGGIVARPGTTYNEVTGATLERISSYRPTGYGARIQGAFQAVQNQYLDDVSNGAYFWENNQSYSNSRNYFNINVAKGIFIETITIGNSTFFKYNPRNTTYGRNIYP